MTAVLLDGQVSWNLTRNEEGHRDYKISHFVRADFTDGPFVVLNTPGLPAIGSIWNFDNDLDPWAFCWPQATVSIHKEKEGDKNRQWKVEQTFSTKPPPSKRCQDESIEDPLLEPQKLSGSFVKYTKEATKDRFGSLIKSSSHEMFRGPQVEFDRNRPTVRVEQNRANLELNVFSQMIDTVNDSPLWGLPARCIKLSNASWERQIYGTCNFYYTRTFEFDIDYETFDRTVIDEGTKVLHGHWDLIADGGTAGGGEGVGWVLDPIGGLTPNRFNPQHFDRFKDRNGENTRLLLNGFGEPLGGGLGVPAGTATGTGPGEFESPVELEIQYYPEANFLLLGIPTTL